MTNAVEFKLDNVTKVPGYADAYVGEFLYKGVHFKFTTASSKSLSRLVNDKSEESIIDAVNNLTILRLEDGVITYVVCSKQLIAELALQICKGF